MTDFDDWPVKDLYKGAKKMGASWINGVDMCVRCFVIA